MVEMTGIEPHVLLTLTTVNAQRILGAGKKKVYTDMAAKLITELGVHDDTRQQAAFLLSASGTTASTFFWEVLLGVRQMCISLRLIGYWRYGVSLVWA